MGNIAAETDADLLARFSRDHAQDAFTELVKRHVNLVYSAGLRQVRSPQLAEEISQSVFSDLARNAGKLKPDTVLAAWLHSVTRRTAVDVIRKEARQRLREQIAVEMTAMNATESCWLEIEPMLDEAVAALDESDRAAVLLRYFENKSLREVGAALGVSDDAAQKRVSRAVERLREFFSKRNVTIGASGLTILISANAVQSAPAALLATISAAVLAGTAVSTATAIATTKVIAMTTLQKALVAATVTVLAGAGIYQTKQAHDARAEVQTLQQQQAASVEEIQRLQAEGDRARNQIAMLNAALSKNQDDRSELLRLRGEVGLLRNQLASTRTESSPPSTQLTQGQTSAGHAPGSYLPIDQLKFAGYATPEAALETITWAVTHGTYEQANEGLSPEMLAAELKDAKGRQQFEAGQAQAATVLKGIQIIAIKTMSDDRIELKIKQDVDPEIMAKISPHLPDYMIQPMVKVGDQWKLSGSTRGWNASWELDGQIKTFVP